MNYGEDEWFTYDNNEEFNKQAESPGTAGQYFEPGNIDNIPLNDDAADPLDFNALDEYQYNDQLRFSPNGADANGHNGQQAGTSGGQYQNMHLMQNTETFDQQMPSTSMGPEYNAFEMPTVVTSQTLDTVPFQDLVMDDPNSYYLNQQPSTSMANDSGMNENYDMMTQQPATYMPQIDQMGGPSSNQQPQPSQEMEVQPPKPKPKKSRPNNKKKQADQVAAGAITVGNMLTEVHKMQQKTTTNSGVVVEAQFTPEESMRLPTLLNEIASLQIEIAQGATDKTDMFNILQAELMGLMSRNVGSSTIIDAVQDLRVAAPPPMQAPAPAPLSAPIKKPPPKRNRNAQQKNVVQQNQPQHMQQEMTPTKIMMEPPTTTMVPSSSNSNNNYSNNNENYGYQQMDQQQGTSQQHYGDYQQPHSQETMHHQGQNQMHNGPMQQMQTKVIPNMNQRTHNYRQSTYFNPNSNGPGPSPQMQPSSHESMHMEQVHQQQHQYHQQEDDGSSQHMYAPHQHEHLQQHQQDDRNMYHQQTPDQMDQGMRNNQGQFQSPQQMRPLVKQPMLHGSHAPTPSPGNPQYGEPMHDNYQQEHHMQSQPQEYDENYGEYFATPQQPGSQMEQMQVHSIHHQYEPQEMYPEMDEPRYEYSYEPEAAPELTKEELDVKMEETREDRQRKVKNMLLEQLDQLEQPVDLTPFRGKVDIFNRMLPYHHFTSTEEPAPEFSTTSQRYTVDLAQRAHTLGNRVRSIVLRDTMRSKTEWEENMLLYLDTESERRQLAEDRAAAEQDIVTFVQKSEIIQTRNSLDLEKTRLAVPPRPAHHNELDVANGQLSRMYKEYEFDSYDENRPRGSPVPFESFIYEPESESEPEPEPEKEEPEPEPLRSDLSPATYTPASPAESFRARNDSETTGELEDEDEESPILSPETDKYAKAADQLHREMFGDDDELAKSTELFPIDEDPVEMPRRLGQENLQTQVPEAVKSSADSSSSTVGSPHKVSRSPSPQPGPSNRVQIPPRSPSPVSYRPSTSTAAAALAPPPPRTYNRVNSVSPEIGDVYFAQIKRVNPADIAPIPLPVPINMIKKEKEDMPKLSFRVPISVYEEGVKLANDDDDIQEIPIVTPVREPIKLRIKLTNIKIEEPSPDRDVPSTSESIQDQQPSTSAVFHSDKEAKTPTPRKNVQKQVEKSSVSTDDDKFKVPTPLKDTPSSESRKRRSAKIEETPKPKKIKEESLKKDLMVTPKNGEVEEERFLRTMTDGRKITMKIGKIPRNINHFVTPRRDGKGNLIKNLSPTPDTRLKMTFRRKNGRLSVEVTEKKEDPVETLKINGPNTGLQSSLSAPVPKSSPPKPRLAPASRKNSIDTAGKDKRNHITKSKTAYCNNFNPFANVPSSIPSFSSAGSSSSMPSTSSMSLSTTSSTSSAAMRPSVQMRTPVARPVQAAPRAVPRVAPVSAPRTPAPMIRTAPIMPPKITISAPTEPAKNSLASLLPWMTDDADEIPERKPNKALLAPFVASQPSTSVASCSSAPAAPSTSAVNIKVEPLDDPVEPEKPQDSPRASSSLSIFFEDDKLPFLSPKRPNEPLPVVEFSDDEENDLAHSTFSSATEHLLSTSAPLNNSSNGTGPPFLPWSSDP